MKLYNDKITLVKNKRGCYILDTIKGCRMCKEKQGGCYNNCYAKNIASRYRYDFSIPVKRDFYKDNNQLYMFGLYDTRHINYIIKHIKRINMPFIRIGEMGDPSEDWKHTISICKEISTTKKPIVIITKHLKIINTNLLNDIKKLNICINTSISALDNKSEIKHRLNQFKRLKKYCNSVLRIVSCDFNKNNKTGFTMSKLQDRLFNHNNIIDTIFRPSINNKLVTNKIINIDKVRFLKSYVHASRFNKKTYFGYCNNCIDMCGIKSY